MTVYLIDCALFFLLGYGLRRLFRIHPVGHLTAFLIVAAIIVAGCAIVEPILNSALVGLRMPAAGAHWLPFGLGLVPTLSGSGRGHVTEPEQRK